MNKKQQIWHDDKIPSIHNGSYQRLYAKAIDEKKLRAAVNSKCLDCTCWQKAEVTKCPAATCPLYSVRPYQRQKARNGGVSEEKHTNEDGNNG